MYNYIKGKVTECIDNLLVVEAGGVGYEFTVSTYTASEVSGKEGEVKIFAYLCVREDDMSLYGFSTRREKAMFLKLIDVSNVGPKLAITVLSGLNVEQLATAVARGDVKTLSSVKGVGKKTAERIILELKDKVGKEYATDTPSSTVANVTTFAVTPNEEAVMALMTLGYSRADSEIAVSKVNPEGLTLEEIIFNALRNKG